MTNVEAIKLLTDNPNTYVYFKCRDATLSHWLRCTVWVEDGVLVQSHPTDDRGPSIAAPTDVDYQVGDDAW